MKNIEHIARVLIVREDKILLCKDLKHGHYFLPGGHVEFGENAEKSLIREMKEESQSEISNFKFAGVFENSYEEDGEIHHEVNILHTANVKDEKVISKESHISFDWVDIDNLTNINFLPKEFAEGIIKWKKEGGVIYLSTLK